MSWLSSGLRSIGITPSEVAQIGAAYATGGLTAAAGTAIGSLGGGYEIGNGMKGPLPPFNPVGQTQQGQSVAISQATQTRPQETQASSTQGYFPMNQQPMQAGFGLLAPVATGVGALARRYAPEIIGGLGGAAVGAAVPMVLDAFGQPKKLRVTRKLKRQVKQAVDLIGIEGVAAEMNVPVATIMYILQHKLRNDGPYVTKAAVRKTSSTLRKMKHLCDMYDELRPAAKRRAPVRRSTAGSMKRTTVVT